MSVDVWDEMDSQSTEAKLKRDQWGRPMVTPTDGSKAVGYVRVTTFAGTLEDGFGLDRYHQRLVAVGLARRPDLVLSAKAHDTGEEDDKAELNSICEQAQEAAHGSAKATVGTAVHKFCERIDRGAISLVDIPESHRADVAAYLTAMAPFKIHGIEEFVVIDEIQVAGTFDRIVEYDGQRYVADIKTGSIEYPHKMAVQLALYSRGWFYDPKEPRSRGNTGVSQSAGIVIHLPAGQRRCDLYWVDLKAGWEAASHCNWTREWRKRKDLFAAASFGAALIELDAPTAHLSTPELAAVIEAQPLMQAEAATTLTEAFAATELTLAQQIAEAGDTDDLEQLWSAHREEWTAEHTRAAAAMKLKWHQQVLHRVSARAAAQSNPA